MALGVKQWHIAEAARDIQFLLINTQRAFRQRAEEWKIIAQTPPGGMTAAILAGWMNAAAAAHLVNIAKITTFKADTPNWNRARSIFAVLGITVSDIDDSVDELTAAANALAAADKSTYSAIIAACDATLAAVDAPISIRS